MVKDLIIYTPMYITFFWSLVLLAASGNNNKAKSFLGVFMIAAFFVYLSHAVFFKREFDAYLIFDPIYILASLSVYPLYYWYIKLLTIETYYNYKNLWLFAPALSLAIVISILYLLMSQHEKNYYLHKFVLNEGVNGINTFKVTAQRIIFVLSRLVFAFQVIYFLIKGRNLVLRYNKIIANFYSNLESKTIVWVNLLLYSFVVTSLISVVFNIIGRTVFLDSAIFLLIPSLIFSILLFFIGLQGYMQNHTVHDLVLDEKHISESDIKEYNQIQLKEKLVLLFSQDKIYHQPDLKITQISSALKTNRTYISNLINKDFNCSFNEFVNEYRIIEAKKMLSNESSKNYSLNHISEAAGFGSVNTFIRVFKDYEGTTPGRYRDNFISQN